MLAIGLSWHDARAGAWHVIPVAAAGRRQRRETAGMNDSKAGCHPGHPKLRDSQTEEAVNKEHQAAAGGWPGATLR